MSNSVSQTIGVIDDEKAHSTIWNVNKASTFRQMLNAKCGQEFQSPSFEIGKFKWRIRCFPNGHIQSQRGSFKIFLTLLCFPKHCAQIRVLRTIKIRETKASVTAVDTYSHYDTNKGWYPRRQLLTELHSLNVNELHIAIKVDVLQIFNEDQQTIFQHIQPIFDNKQVIQWTINDQQMLQLMKQSEYGKIFENECGEQDLFGLQCSPKGHNKERGGYVSLFVYLRINPVSNACKYKCEVTFYCTENKETWTRTSIFDIGNNPNRGCGNFCRSSSLFISSNGNWSSSSSPEYKSITFRAEIEILSILDNKNQEIPRAKWSDKSSTNRFDYEQCIRVNRKQSNQNEDEKKEGNCSVCTFCNDAATPTVVFGSEFQENQRSAVKNENANQVEVEIENASKHEDEKKTANDQQRNSQELKKQRAIELLMNGVGLLEYVELCMNEESDDTGIVNNKEELMEIRKRAISSISYNTALKKKKDESRDDEQNENSDNYKEVEKNLNTEVEQ